MWISWYPLRYQTFALLWPEWISHQNSTSWVILNDSHFYFLPLCRLATLCVASWVVLQVCPAWHPVGVSARIHAVWITGTVGPGPVWALHLSGRWNTASMTCWDLFMCLYPHISLLWSLSVTLPLKGSEKRRRGITCHFWLDDISGMLWNASNQVVSEINSLFAIHKQVIRIVFWVIKGHFVCHTDDRMSLRGCDHCDECTFLQLHWLNQ